MNNCRVCARIDLDKIGKNVTRVRNTISDSTMIMAVVKADAYGHGAVEIASYLSNKVEWFGVATLDEAVELRINGIKNNILILGAVMPEDYSDIVKYDITATIFDLDRAEKLNLEAIKQNKIANVHIKLDTGMSRIGFSATDESADIVAKIADMSNINVEGVFSHFAKADEFDKSFSFKQKESFDSFIFMLSVRGVEIKIKHLYNSAGIMELDNTYDMVRMGIMLYGYYPSEEMSRSYKLYPALELLSQVSYVKEIKAGTGVSYGHVFVADRDILVATVPVGYADGYPRCLSNKGEVIINGKKCPIIGRVCMDQFMVDVTGLSEVNVGDEVVIVGQRGDVSISVEDIADNSYSFNYEFICGISRRVPRVYFDNERFIEKISYLK